MPAEAYLAVAAVLFGVGLVGVIAHASAISALIGTQLMLDAAILAAVATAGAAPVEGELAAVAFIVVGGVGLATGLAVVIDVTRRGLGPETDGSSGEA